MALWGIGYHMETRAMTRTAYGFLHVESGKDMDGSNHTFCWVEKTPQKFDMNDEQFEEYDEKPGWFAMCEIEPEAGWIGPFEKETDAVKAATDEHFLHQWEVSLM